MRGRPAAYPLSHETRQVTIHPRLLSSGVALFPEGGHEGEVELVASSILPGWHRCFMR